MVYLPMMLTVISMSIVYVSPAATGQEVRSGFRHNLINISSSVGAQCFAGSMVVRNQIHCCAECLKVRGNTTTTYYYAFFESNHHRCVCKEDWHQIPTQSGEYEMKWIEVRKGQG